MIRRFTLLFLLLVILIPGPGCSYFKKLTNNDRTTPKEKDSAPARTKDEDPLLSPGVQNKAGTPSVLAGQVLDFNRKPPRDTSIRYVCMEDGAKPKEATVTGDGYFAIWDTRPGKKYMLEARAKSGDKVVAGIAYATAPNMRVTIDMKEEFVGAHTSQPQGPEALLPGAKQPESAPFNGVTIGPATMAGLDRPEASTRPVTPGTWVGKGADDPTLHVAINIPVLDAIPPTSPVPPLPTPKPGFVEAPKSPGMPTLSIPSQRESPTPNFPAPPPPVAPLSQDFGPAQVPSAVVVGKQVVNFALRDVNESSWELKRDRQGKLVLLDFWFAGCGPCKDAFPYLNKLQSKYPAQVLEVVGINNESFGTPEEKRMSVLRMNQTYHFVYRQLLDQNELAAQLGVKSYPTMVLLDENGYIIWRHIGRFDAAVSQEVERIIAGYVRK